MLVGVGMVVVVVVVVRMWRANLLRFGDRLRRPHRNLLLCCLLVSWRAVVVLARRCRLGAPPAYVNFCKLFKFIFTTCTNLLVQ